ncbi:hypothetical protein [Chitinophaga japonensis]|uniref:Uncharacterized protein n=1 Tax=Chitinophaga japonensis TaxID=104662 RepID=A0A562T419_CHIJA|nr:hypothetical protein [Chitinophaga japonensis]TWI88242.1 hypothetical protein LX66_2327 [Chitinophaga japonensis]
MREISDSIFDEQFLAEVLIRRRRLMPLALKIYVWIYMIVSGLGLLLFSIGIADMGTWQMMVNVTSPGFMLGPALFLFGGMFLLNLFIWLEKRWSILWTLAITGFTILILFITKFPFIDGTSPVYSKPYIWVTVIAIPYLVMLWRIKDKWERG